MMSNELRTLNQDIISSLVIKGDLKGLTPTQKMEYYGYRCSQSGLDPAAKPFDLLVLNGKEVLYANAGCTQQLTSIHKLSHAITGRELVEGVYCVFCRVTGPDGRSTENVGAVPVEGLKGEPKANAMLKATTKAIRRSVLAHCGLGMMDETEVETIPNAQRVPLPELAETTTTPANGWDIDSNDEFEKTLERAYIAFKTGGKPEAYEGFTSKWKARKTEPAEKVLTEMAAFVVKLETAAAKKLEKAS